MRDLNSMKEFIRYRIANDSDHGTQKVRSLRTIDLADTQHQNYFTYTKPLIENFKHFLWENALKNQHASEADVSNTMMPLRRLVNLPCSRTTECLLFRFITGKNSLRKFLLLLNPSISPICNRCQDQKIESPIHLLLECSSFEGSAKSNLIRGIDEISTNTNMVLQTLPDIYHCGCNNHPDLIINPLCNLVSLIYRRNRYLLNSAHINQTVVAITDELVNSIAA